MDKSNLRAECMQFDRTLSLLRESLARARLGQSLVNLHMNKGGQSFWTCWEISVPIFKMVRTLPSLFADETIKGGSPVS